MKRAEALALTGFAAVFIAAKLAILDVPAYWDETRWVGQAFQLATWPIVSVFPGFRPAGAFAGHPPGIHLIFALLAKIAGSSMRTAHLVTIGFGAAGIGFTFLLGRRLFDRWTGFLAAILLFVCPMYFAQSGMFLADVPVAALSTGCVYFLLSRRTIGYLVCATAMVLIKETAAAIVLAMLAYDVLFIPRERAHRLRAAGRHLVPLLALGIFVVWQKIVTGSWWLIYTDPFDSTWFETTIEQIARQAWAIAAWIFLEQWRWLLAAPLFLGLLILPPARRRRELWLFGLIAIFASVPFAFAGMLFLPRYLMPVLPLFFVATAWMLRQLLQPLALRAGVASLVLATMTWALFARPFAGTAELNMRYLDVVRVHQEMASSIERDFSSSRVLTLWPQTRELTVPEFGYVHTPIAIVDAESLVDFDRAFASADLLWVTPLPEIPGVVELRNRAIEKGWQAVRTFSRGPVVSELFARPGPPRDKAPSSLPP